MNEIQNVTRAFLQSTGAIFGLDAAATTFLSNEKSDSKEKKFSKIAAYAALQLVAPFTYSIIANEKIPEKAKLSTSIAMFGLDTITMLNITHAYGDPHRFLIALVGRGVASIVAAFVKNMYNQKHT